MAPVYRTSFLSIKDQFHQSALLVRGLPEERAGQGWVRVAALPALSPLITEALRPKGSAFQGPQSLSATEHPPN